MIEGVLVGRRAGRQVPRRRGASAAGLALFPIGGLGVLVGLAMYLPFEITLGYGIGCLLPIVLEKVKGQRFIGDVWCRSRRG